MATLLLSPRVRVARALAEALLHDQPARLAHSAAVAARAEELSVTVDPADRDVLVIAAWLHDIGYSAQLVDSGLHELDGARHLDRHAWPARVAALVAHHSGAVFAAELLGARDRFDRYIHEHSPVSDALAYADQTVSPTGERVTLDERLAEVLTRHGPDSVRARVHHVRAPYLRAVAERVEYRLR
jgi:putative nucleotidyltransferase with HDIG domain